MADDLLGAITAIIPVVTFPIGVLALFFVSWEVAMVVFVVGWFLLTPLIPIVGEELLPALADESDDAGSGGEAADPLAELRSRYARGEIGDEEFEHGVEKLIATEGIEVDRDAVFDREATTNGSSNGEWAADGDRDYDVEHARE